MLKKVAKGLLIIAMGMVMISSNCTEARAEGSKRVSMNSLYYLCEEENNLKGVINSSKVVTKAEEVYQDILTTSKSKIVVSSKKDGLTPKEVRAVAAIIDHKFYTYVYGLEYSEESSIGSYEITINVSKARKLLQKNKKLEDTMNRALFQEMGINSNTTEYDACVKINEWFCKNIKYDYSATSVMYFEDVLLKKKGICATFADTMKIMCNRLGIECNCVVNVSMGHAWNKVIVDNRPYYTDLTWDLCGYEDTYSMLSLQEMNKTHKVPDWTDSFRIKIPRYYKVVYNTNKSVSNKNVSHYVEGDSVALTNPRRKGYTFLGWYTSRDYKKRVYNLNQVSPYNNTITLYPKWSKVVKPVISNVKVKNKNKSTKISWFVNKDSGNVRYLVSYRNQDKHFKTVVVGDDSLTILKERTTSKYKYTIKITPYIKDSYGLKVKGKSILLEDGKVIK